jgi:predicted CXXCH cytochrome family protein
VHNHEPVDEDCTICHNPHGSNIDNMLKARPPMLCVQCHGPSSHPTQPPALPVGSPTETFNTNARIMGTVGRGCLNCHTNIHGSNSTMNNATVERFRR